MSAGSRPAGTHRKPEGAQPRTSRAAIALLAGPALNVAGDYPHLRLVDARLATWVWTAAALVLVVFAALAAWGMR